MPRQAQQQLSFGIAIHLIRHAQIALIQSQREEDLRFVHAELSELQYQMKVAALASRNPNNLNSMANPPLPQMTDE